QAFSKLDPNVINSPLMEKVLTTFRRLRRETDWQAPQHDWTEATRAVIRGKAAMQIVGDWAKPIFVAAAESSGFQFQCVAPPGTGDGYIFTSDSFVMFAMADAAKARAQQDFARLVMQPDVQQQFNMIKGSIPANQEADLSGFDRCGQQSATAFRQATQSNSLVPSFSMSVRAEVEDAVREVISDYWRDDRVTTQQTMKRLVAVLTAPTPSRRR
ncbi:extracellular solute-binding protein, partial [Roseateles sp. P5_E11]